MMKVWSCLVLVFFMAAAGKVIAGPSIPLSNPVSTSPEACEYSRGDSVTLYSESLRVGDGGCSFIHVEKLPATNKLAYSIDVRCSVDEGMSEKARIIVGFDDKLVGLTFVELDKGMSFFLNSRRISRDIKLTSNCHASETMSYGR